MQGAISSKPMYETIPFADEVVETEQNATNRLYIGHLGADILSPTAAQKP